MSSIALAPPAVSTPRCPSCGEVPISERTTLEGGVITGNYCDHAGHVWSMRWLAGDA